MDDRYKIIKHDVRGVETDRMITHSRAVEAYRTIIKLNTMNNINGDDQSSITLYSLRKCTIEVCTSKRLKSLGF